MACVGAPAGRADPSNKLLIRLRGASTPLRLFSPAYSPTFTAPYSALYSAKKVRHLAPSPPTGWSDGEVSVAEAEFNDAEATVRG